MVQSLVRVGRRLQDLVPVCSHLTAHLADVPESCLFPSSLQVLVQVEHSCVLVLLLKALSRSLLPLLPCLSLLSPSLSASPLSPSLSLSFTCRGLRAHTHPCPSPLSSIFLIFILSSPPLPLCSQIEALLQTHQHLSSPLLPNLRVFRGQSGLKVPHFFQISCFGISLQPSVL